MSRQQSLSLGSVYRRSDGYWVAALVVAGRRIVRYAKTERGAKEKLLELQRQHSIGALTPPTKMKVSEWVETWLRQRFANIRPSTAATYAQVLRPLVERIGHIRLDRLTPVLLADTIYCLQEQGMGTRRVQMCCTYTRTCLKAAVELGIIGTSPADRVRKPKYAAAERHYWDAQEMRSFPASARASGHQHAPLLVYLLATGCRMGEALGLRWGDVDLWWSTR